MRRLRYAIEGISLAAVVFLIGDALEKHGMLRNEAGFWMNCLIIVIGVPIIFIERRLSRQR